MSGFPADERVQEDEARHPAEAGGIQPRERCTATYNAPVLTGPSGSRLRLVRNNPGAVTMADDSVYCADSCGQPADRERPLGVTQDGDLIVELVCRDHETAG